MTKKLASILSTGLVCAVLLGTKAYGIYKYESITLLKDQTWNTRSAISRTCNYSYVNAKLFSVSPLTGGTDNFTRVQVRAVNSNGTAITNTITLNETNSSGTNFSIKEGYLNTTSIKFQFRGNDPDYGATAVVSYNSY